MYNCSLFLGMNFLTRLKIWEWLLLIAVILLGCIVFELHNAPGRYVEIGTHERGRYRMIDTRTGEVFRKSGGKWEPFVEGVNW